jgi:hypothetical protein
LQDRKHHGRLVHRKQRRDLARQRHPCSTFGEPNTHDPVPHNVHIDQRALKLPVFQLRLRCALADILAPLCDDADTLAQASDRVGLMLDDRAMEPSEY